MESAGLRHKASVQSGGISPLSSVSLALVDRPPEQPIHVSLRSANGRKKKQRGSPVPRFAVDLSLPPEQRYAHLFPELEDRIEESDLIDLFDDLVHALAGSVVGGLLIRAAPLLLRRVRDPEQTAELRGIAGVSRVPMHVLVAFNVLLDLLLGCTSCGIRVLPEDVLASSSSPAAPATPPHQHLPGTGRSRMLHFRTLDWGMDQLRRLVVQLDFVRGAGGPVVATTLTYYGFVGVLTGVRRGLSLSLNFRPRHDRSTLRRRLAFRWHQALVLLGFRDAIASELRRFLFAPAPRPASRAVEEASRGRSRRRGSRAADDFLGEEKDAADQAGVEAILRTLSTSKSTAAYLIFCTPQRVYVVEKDHGSALIRDSDTFLTAYNHDAADERDPSHLAAAAEELAANDNAVGMHDLVMYSLDRKAHLDKLYRRRCQACRRQFKNSEGTVSVDDVMHFVKDWEISNDETHYAVVMDPDNGAILWSRLYDA